MRKIAVVVSAIIASAFVVSGSVEAAFTSAEVTSISKLRDAGRNNRLALRNHETNIATKTAADTRDLFGEIEHGLDESIEAVVNGTFYTLNAAAERDDVQRDLLRTLPRTEYMIRAKREFDTSLTELAEARAAAVEAQALRPTDTAYQTQLTKVIFYIDQTVSKLNAFDRNLTYSDPPQGVCPAPFTTCIQDEGFQFLGQYGYDIADVLVSSWAALPAGTSYSAYAGALSQFWLIQDTGMDVCFRVSGVISGTVSDSIDSLFGASTSTVNQRFNGLMVSLIALRPTTGTAVDFARIDQKFSDSWRHDDRLGRTVLLTIGI